MTVMGHFSAGYIGYAAQAGVPAPGLLVPLSGVIAILGGLSVTLGYKAKVGAWLLVLFLVPVTLKMHAFWAVTDPMMRGIQIAIDRKSTRLNSSHSQISYAVFCLKKKKRNCHNSSLVVWFTSSKIKGRPVVPMSSIAGSSNQCTIQRYSLLLSRRQFYLSGTSRAT